MTLQTKLPGSAIQSGSIPVTAITNFSGELSASLPSNVVSSSAQVTVLLPADTVSSSVQVTAFLPVGTVSSSTQLPSGIASSSAQVIAYLPADTVSSSTQVTTFLPTNTVSSSGQVTAFLPTGTVSSSGQVGEYPNIATTGSNTFVGIQTISDTTNSTSYLDGALTVAGGMSVRKDVRVSGSLTVNGLLTAVSMSTQYVTSSEYTIGTSKIILNDDDLVRFAGLSIVDSGSASPATASIFWDSLQHRFIYENLSGSSYNSSILIAGPKHTGTLGDEVGLTDFRIPVAHGSDHIDSRPASSSIRVDFPSRLTHVEAGLYVTGAISASGETVISGDLTVDTTTFKVDSTNNRVGIGTASPSYTLDVDRGASNGVAAKLGRSSGQAAYVYVDTTSVYLGSDATGNTSWQFNESSDYLAAFTAGNERLRLDTSGNLGLGVTPSAWSTVTALQVKNAAFGGFSNSAYLFANAYYDGSNFKYIASAFAAQYRQQDSQHQWYTAPSGTAGNTISFTQAMTLDANGNLGVGATSPSASYRLTVQGVGTVGNPLGGIAFRQGATDVMYMGNITADNSTDFELWNPRNGYTRFGTNNTEHMRITSGGNVGIGTTSPSQKLTVIDTLSITNSSGVQYLLIGNQDSSGVNNPAMIQGVNGNLVFGGGTSWTGSGGTFTATMYLADGGNVGIGITSPESKLHINGVGTNDGLQINTIKTYVTERLTANATQARRFEIARLGIDYNDWNGGIGPFIVEIFEAYYSRGLYKRYIVNYGYVQNSSCDLVEYQGSGDNQYQVTIGSPVQVSGDNYYLPVYVDVRYYGQCDVRIQTNRTRTSNTTPGIGETYVNLNPSPSNISDFTPDSQVTLARNANAYLVGNVGIGTASPLAGYALDVVGKGNFSNWVRADAFYLPSANVAGARDLISGENTNTGTTGKIRAFLQNSATSLLIEKYGTGFTSSGIATQAGSAIYDDGAGGLSIGATNGSGTLRLFAGNTERARITSGGQLLVAKTAGDLGNVGYRFDTDGASYHSMAGSTNGTATLHVYSTGASAYRFYVGMDGTINATNTTISAISDARLKENIRDLDVGLDAILALKPRTFDWKEGKGADKKDVRGFIAQEFEEVFPDLVDEWKDEAPEGEEPYRSIRQDLIPVLVKAIQELEARIAELEAGA